MSQVDLIDVHDAFEHVSKGSALLICAYESDEKFGRLQLEGAVPLSEFQAKLNEVDEEKELIFY